MTDKEEFLTSHNIEPEELKAAGPAWEELAAICDDYLSAEGKPHSIGKDLICDYLYDIERADIHPYRYHTKDPDHLIKKIICKRSEHFERFEDVSRSNYHKYITDLVGIRMSFLHREDRVHFRKYITSVFENNPVLYVVDRIKNFDEDPRHYYIAERPEAYRKNGDTRIYDENLIEIKSNGIYQPLRCIIKYKGYYVEIQGRILFEEGQNETDHDIVYPYFQNDKMLKDLSTLLNRLSSMADEMSSYSRRMKGVKEEWERRLERHDDEGQTGPVFRHESGGVVIDVPCAPHRAQAGLGAVVSGGKEAAVGHPVHGGYL